MAIGFFNKEKNGVIPDQVLAATNAVFRLDTGRTLHYRLCNSADEADQWTGFVVDKNGREIYQSGWTQTEIDDLNLDIPGPDWAKGFRHELILHLAKGGKLPYQTPLTGFGTAILVSSQGHLLTNQHMISGPQKHHDIPERQFISEGLPAPYLRILTESKASLGPVRLCYVDTDLDLAVLKIPPPSGINPATIAKVSPSLHTRVWQWGYPHRSFRTNTEKMFLQYQDANHDLCYSPGLIVAKPSPKEWFSDGDAVLGSSGSAMLNDTGELVGIYRGGGAPKLYPDAPYRYRRCVDIAMLKADLPDMF